MLTTAKTAKADAEAALRDAFADPRESTRRAEAALGAARAAHDPTAESLALQALGLAARLLGDVSTAVDRLQESVRTAENAGLHRRAAEARITLSLALTMAGRTAAALDALDTAARALTGAKLAQLEVQRALILRRLGDLDAALAELRRAIPTLRRGRNGILLARALNERGMIQVERSAFRAADADFDKANALFQELGQRRDAAATRHNRGWCAARGGDVVAALQHYDQAEQELVGLGIVVGEQPLDRARVLLSVGLASDALILADRAAEIYDGSAHKAGWAEATLTAAEAALTAGDPATAAAKAAEARQAFSKQRRPGWVALARRVEIGAAWSSGDRSPGLYTSALRVAADLERLGVPTLATEALLIAGKTALALDRPSAARQVLGRASRGRDRGPADQRVRAWLAEALLRLADGRRASALSALRAGVGVVDSYRTSLGATELRAHASSAGVELATLGLRLALENAEAGQVLAWTERWRASCLRLRPVRPPVDTGLASELGELRKVVFEVEHAASQSRSTSDLIRRQRKLEDSVRRLSHRAASASEGPARPPAVEELAETLGDRVMVELVEVDGDLHAVVIVDGHAVLKPLGPMQPVVTEMDSARFGLRRLSLGRGSAASLAGADAAVTFAGHRLEDHLFEPIREHLGDRPLVVVPPARLHALPWAILPSCRARPLAVAPSAAFWLRAARATPPSGERVVLVAGPGLPGVLHELAALSALHPGAICLSAEAATAEATTAALGGASLAHIAAHGSFRADNALFSSLRLADGPVNVFDIEALAAPPHRVVLSACDSGLAGVRPGDELMGLAAALCSIGTAALVVSVVPVPDVATAELMVALHRRLLAGDGMATALARARLDVAGSDCATTAAAAGFICIGAG